MINLRVKNRGESLPEVLVAVGILVVVLVVSLMLVSRGISTNVSVKNKIIALNIAREGLEGMRNIRDTNWLEYSGNRRNKWLYDKVDDANIGSGDYVIDFKDGVESFRLQRNIVQTNQLNLSDESLDFSSYRLYKNPANYSRYTHDPGTAPNENTPTIFYRQLILKADKPPECDGVGSDKYSCDDSSRLHVISRVQWKESLIAGDESASTNSLIGTIVMETYLYDYLDREEY